jgi:starch phosphorylase
VHSTLSVRAFVSLGSLTPEDVDVELVHGTIAHEDDLVDTAVTPLAPTESYDDGRHRYEGSVTLDRTGPFGYTVRILPKHSLLASPAELGVVALP